jgi:aminotransferase EvaB
MNFLVKQYKRDNNYKIKHNYLQEQFKSSKKKILQSVKKLLNEGDYTLGQAVIDFEKKIAKLLKSNYVVSVGSGTDALMLSLKALGVQKGDEVITSPYTFYATIGAIVTAGAKPVFVDVKSDYNINEDLIEKKISKKTKVILPIHWSGRICNMKKIKFIAKKHNLKIVEDSCHAILAKKYNKYAGTFSDFGCFSMHPLKNLNVCGDGGFVIVKKKKDFEKLKLLRNHGLISRNVNQIFAYNSRLDTLQAYIGLEMIKKIKFITRSRIKNAQILDKMLSKIPEIKLIRRDKNSKEVFHLYEIRTFNKKIRNQLINFLNINGIDAKIHYPIPMHLQPASKIYGYGKGDFPNAEKISDTTISLPIHEFVKIKDLKFIVEAIRKFYYAN